MKKEYCDICGDDLTQYIGGASSRMRGGYYDGYHEGSSYYSTNYDFCASCTDDVSDVIIEMKKKKQEEMKNHE